jgi:spore coat polysaccharide biosynthesis protein SpsF
MFDGLITVRSLSSRLPGKCYLNFGDKTVLDYIILRCLHYKIRPIICTTKDKSDDKIIEIAIKNKISYFRGSISNKIKRWSDCANHFKSNFFHTIDADDLFFCGEEMLLSINQLKKNKNIDIIFPSKLSSEGSAFVGYSFTNKSINQLSKSIPARSDTEMVDPYIKKNKNIKYSILRDPELYKYKARMTLDYIEDYFFLDKIRSKLRPFPKRKHIFTLLKNEPELSKINIKKNKLWKNNQISKIQSLI